MSRHAINPFTPTLADTLAILATPLTLWQVISILLTLGGLGLIVAMILLRRKPRASADDIAAAARLDTQRADLERMMDDCRELTHLLGQRLDQQADRAEAAAERLKQLLAAIESAEHAARHEPERTTEPPPQHIEERKPTTEIDALAGRVYDLADQGLTAADIARRLGQHTGKVELLLALRAGLGRA